MFPLQNANLWNESLKVVSQCPLCKSRQNDMEARVLGQDGEARLLYLNCHKCGNSLLALVLVSHSGVSSIGMVTDLSYDDVRRFHQVDQVCTDDVLQIHQEMNQTEFLQRI
jgi:hypothetical protein